VTSTSYYEEPLPLLGLNVVVVARATKGDSCRRLGVEGTDPDLVR
jgi:hypothetical protein